MAEQQPNVVCNDKHCPYHGHLKVHGFSFVGVVTSSKARRTVTVEWTRVVDSKKYERKYRRKTKVHAHNPDCVNAKEGDLVLIKETRPISKTKHFVVMKVITRKEDLEA